LDITPGHDDGIPPLDFVIEGGTLPVFVESVLGPHGASLGARIEQSRKGVEASDGT